MFGINMTGGSRRRRRTVSKGKKSKGKKRGVKRVLKGTRKVLKRARKLNRSLLNLLSPKRRF